VGHGTLVHPVKGYGPLKKKRHSFFGHCRGSQKRYSIFAPVAVTAATAARLFFVEFTDTSKERQLKLLYHRFLEPHTSG